MFRKIFDVLGKRPAIRDVKQPEGLISVLLDRNAPYGDRDDAAMDLSMYDDHIAVEALERIISDSSECVDLKEECEHSLIEIKRRRVMGAE